MASAHRTAFWQEFEATMKNTPSTPSPHALSRPRRYAVSSRGSAVTFGAVRRTVTAVLVASLLTGCAALGQPERFKLDIPANTGDFRNRLYTGVSMGTSNLSPNTRGEGFTVESSSDMGTQLRLGYDVHNMLAVEVDTSVLGRSTLSPSDPFNPTAEVKYSAATVSALVYGWSGVQARSRREGLSAYGRVGFAALSKSSQVKPIEESGTLPILGVGAEYGFASGLGIRAEVTRFDSDATYVGFGAIYRFGISPKGIGRMIADAAEPAFGNADTTVARSRGYSDNETIVERYAGPNARPGRGAAPHLHYTSGAEPDQRYVGSMAERWRPAMRADDRDSDGVLDNVDSCPDTSKHVTVDRYGCGLFDAVLHDVTFKSGSRWLTPRARGQLDLLAETLLAFPEARIQVRAHTDSRGPADMNLGLSSRRAEVVIQYLQSKGVHELQLQAVGMGEAQPLDANDTRKGRLRNRRVDIVTLPDQDAGQLLMASNVESNAVMTVQNKNNVQDDKAGTPVLNEDWNSAPRSGKPKKSTGRAYGRTPKKSGAEPGLMAAMPDMGAPGTIRRAGVSFPSMIAPLPQPGFAPNFGFAGVLEDVSFDGGDSSLSQKSLIALKPLKEALLRDPSVRVAIMAHTDDQGALDDNKALSTKRAQSVVEYLVNEGVDATRLKAEGYGELLPLVQNVTDADRQRNRRIEVRVLQ